MTEFDSVFRDSDIRGRVSDAQLNPQSVHRIITAFAHLLRERDVTSAVVGYDNRECSASFSDAACAALTENGVDVYRIGPSTSPMSYFAQHHLSCRGLVMITASHNPNGWSGFKLSCGYSRTLAADDIRAIHDLVRHPPPTPDVPAGIVTDVDVRDAYIDAIASRVKMGTRPLRVVVDAGNGAAGVIAYELFHRLGVLAFQLNCDPDYNYPHYFPNPSDLHARARLREMTLHPYIRADVGFGFDGDGDRIGVVDENGGDVWADTALCLLAEQALRAHPGGTVVFDLKCSQAVAEVVRRSGGTPVVWKTGHGFIKGKMAETGAVLAGERSGHLFFGGDYYGFDDALYAAAKLCELLSNDTRPLSEIIADYPRYKTSPEIYADCADRVKYEVQARVTAEFQRRYPGQVTELGGTRVQFERGWGVVRASSNMPQLTMLFEAEDDTALAEIKDIFRAELARHPEVGTTWHNEN